MGFTPVTTKVRWVGPQSGGAAEEPRDGQQDGVVEGREAGEIKMVGNFWEFFSPFS